MQEICAIRSNYESSMKRRFQSVDYEYKRVKAYLLNKGNKQKDLDTLVPTAEAKVAALDTSVESIRLEGSGTQN